MSNLTDALHHYIKVVTNDRPQNDQIKHARQDLEYALNCYVHNEIQKALVAERKHYVQTYQDLK